MTPTVWILSLLLICITTVVIVTLILRSKNMGKNTCYDTELKLPSHKYELISTYNNFQDKRVTAKIHVMQCSKCGAIEQKTIS